MSVTEEERKGRQRVGQDGAIPPTAGLWQAIVETPKALEIVTKGKKGATRRIVVERYLATPTTQKELEQETGITNQAVSSMICRTVKKIFPYLRQEVRDAYGSPEQALKARLSFKCSTVNARRGQAIEAGTYTGKPMGRPRGGGRRG